MEWNHEYLSQLLIYIGAHIFFLAKNVVRDQLQVIITFSFFLCICTPLDYH